MSLGAVNETNRNVRAHATAVEPSKAALPNATPEATGATQDPARAPAPEALSQSVREIMKGVEGEMQRRLEVQQPWDEAGIKRPCPRGGNCSGGPKRGLAPARRTA